MLPGGRFREEFLIEVFRVDLPYSGGSYRLSAGRRYERLCATLERILKDAGPERWGEQTPFGSVYVAARAAGVRNAIAGFAPGAFGRDPRRPDGISDAIDAVLAVHHSARARIDVACREIPGKGERYARLRSDPLVLSIGADDPDMIGRVSRYREQGFRVYSFKTGAERAEGNPGPYAGRIRACPSDRTDGE